MQPDLISFTQYDNMEDGKPNEVGGCPSDLRAKDWATKAKVRYIRDKSLEVFLDVRGDSSWELCFRADGVKLPSVGYLGFSALTGEISDAHDILSVSTSGIVIVSFRPYFGPKIRSVLIPVCNHRTRHPAGLPGPASDPGVNRVAARRSTRQEPEAV